MRIRTLGCSGGIGSPLDTTCFQVDDDILIDAGTGLSALSLEQMRGVRHIFLTHSHLDHVAGLPLMIDSVFSDLAEPVVVHASAETLAALREHIFNWVIWPDFSVLPLAERPVIRFEEMQPGRAVELDGRRIEMIPVNHVVPGVGYRIAANGHAVAFSGDTMTNDSLWEALNAADRLDVLVVECAFGDQDLELSRKAHHYCPSMLAADLEKLRHRPEIYVTHLKPGAEDRIFAEIRARVPDRSLHRLSGGDVIQL
ncbi:MBL fold metallo-hydrolase [Thiohalobacter sp.]|uniref:MBL fold metallo-hydrolase n=1 Tax=Thiohalobacter sp. TaxID=2025948 RepID=UPI00262C44D6|nr:3',5'-cyclic-nucleotide phosphodiesterase [Thiohalobacter sp.]